MNLTTVLVTLVIAGSATPGISRMALQPVIAQKRATNFGVAETQAVTFAAKNEGRIALTKTPDQCKLQEIGNNAFTITCWEGKSKYKMSATRAFRQGTSASGTGATASEFNSIATDTGATTTGNNNVYSEDASASASGTSHEENYTTHENQSSGDRTSSDEKHTTNDNQSSKARTSSEEKRTTHQKQSSRDQRPSDTKEYHHHHDQRYYESNRTH